MKWIEVNIERPDSVSKDDYLIKLVRPVLDDFKARIESWHFLWEGKPWPSTLRLRFFGDNETIKQLRKSLEQKLKDISHCYGEHGDCGEDKEYKGEADSWGTQAWEKGIRFLELGAEFALELVENKDTLGKSDEYKKSAFAYADRYTHLFLNQISSVVDEADFYLKEGVFRYAHGTMKSLAKEKINSIVEQTKQKIANA